MAVSDDERVRVALYDLLDPMAPDWSDISVGYLAELAAKRIVASEAEVADLRQRKDVAYDERNRMVAVLSKIWPAHLAQHPESDTTWERDWMTIVCIHSPMGQLTWHVHDDQRLLFAHLTMSEGHWDGHSTEEKYARLAAMGVTRTGDAVDRVVEASTDRPRAPESSSLSDPVAAARPAPPDPPEGWHPISTAPKDGSGVLIYAGAGNSMRVCYWRDGWAFYGTRGGATVYVMEPTHWRRLPDPPEAESK